MATGTIFNPFITQVNQLTAVSSKINEGNVRANRVGNFIALQGWFHMNSAGANKEVLYNWPSGLAPATGGFVMVANASESVAIEYKTDSIIVYSSLAVGYWNIATVLIPIT